MDGLTKSFLLATLLVALVGCDEGVKVSSFGYDPVDSTEIIQRALDSGLPKLVFDADRGPWITRPLMARSNQTLVFEEGAELLAKRGEYHGIRDSLLNLLSVTNVSIVGRGKGATFRMWKTDYQDLTRYARSEWRMALRLSGVLNVRIENMAFRSSGGDGICIGSRDGVPSRNVTIRNCVCDDNHRQGISACVFDGLLIEDCVLSNTKGTAPQAGIDIEPNHAPDAIRNLVLRNVKSINNAGSGFEVMLHNANRASTFADFRFENCLAQGNRTGVFVVGNHVRDWDIVRGDISFRDCRFEGNRTHGISLTGVPKGTLNVRFDRCSVTGSPESQEPDVVIATLGAMQGLPDHVEFNDLRVIKRNGGSWFRFTGTGVGPAPSAVRGNVEVISTNGTVERAVLDEKWVAATFPVVDGGKPVPPMKPLPVSGKVTAVDLKPGELVDLAPINVASYARNFLLYVEKPMTVRLRLSGPKAQAGQQIEVFRIRPDGSRSRVTRLPMPGPDGAEVSFEVSKDPGFHALVLPSEGLASRVERSNVPIALDLTGWSPLLQTRDQKPFALWFWASEGRGFSAYASSRTGRPFAAELRDSDGRVVRKGDSQATNVVLADLPEGPAKSGLWSFVLSPVPNRGAFNSIRLGIGGLPGYYFLSGEKYWK